jgi:hypothetical protein
VKASNDQNAPSETLQGSTLIDCLFCGHDLGDESAPRCPKCGRETSEADAQVRAARRELNDGGSVGIPLAISLGCFLASLLFAPAFNAGADGILIVALLLLAPFLFGLSIFAFANNLLVPRQHRSLVFRAWILTTPRLALWLAVPLGLMAIAWLGGVDLALGLDLPWLVIVLAPTFLFGAISLALHASWRRRLFKRLERLGLGLTRPTELVMYFAAVFVGLMGSILLSLTVDCILSQIART